MSTVNHGKVVIYKHEETRTSLHDIITKGQTQGGTGGNALKYTQSFSVGEQVFSVAEVPANHVSKLFKLQLIGK